MKTVMINIGGMTCSACSSGLEKFLNKQPGIKSVEVNLVLQIATIKYDDITIKDIEKYVKSSGFEYNGIFENFNEEKYVKNYKGKLIISASLLIFMMYISMHHMFDLPKIPIINHDNPIVLSTTFLVLSIIFIYYGFDIIKMGIKNLIHKIPNMDTLVTFSVLSSFIYSLYGYINILQENFEYLNDLYFESTCMVIFFIKLGRLLENSSKDKTKDAIKNLVEVTPKKALLKRKDNNIEVTLDEINVGDIIICRPNEKIAVDGIVVNNSSYVDESLITGESTPILKNKGKKVLAGSLNMDSAIEIKAEALGKESTISRIVSLVVEATNNKSKTQKLADKVSGYFVYFIIFISLVTFIIQILLGQYFSVAINHFVTILVVACPCAIGLAIPLVTVTSSGLCAKKGLFIKSGEVLEKTKNINTIVFDKTGTLTQGKISIYKMFNYSCISDEILINIVANLEENSNHPIKNAFVKTKSLTVSDFKNHPGLGISGKIKNDEYYLGNKKVLDKLNIDMPNMKDYEYLENSGCSIIFIIKNKEVLGLIGTKDILRNNIKDLVSGFNKENIKVIMLTGDNKKTANIIASELNIKNVYAECMPDEKEKIIKELKDNGQKIIMVGDGINDAPALATSDIGISISDGSDIASDASDVILMNNNLQNILDLIHIGKKSYRIIKQNLFWAFFYNVCMIPIAAGLFVKFGLSINPMFGSLAMVLSSITVILNSLRLRR